jgi:hypothetical protein
MENKRLGSSGKGAERAKKAPKEGAGIKMG